MEMEPSSRGLQSLADALPHPISVLQALLPGAPRVRDVSFSTRDPQAARFCIRFRYETDVAGCDAAVTLTHSDRRPRRTALALDGRRALRQVSPQDYRLCFADAGRSVPLPDPLTLLVFDFVAALRSGGRAQPAPILQRMQVLAAIAAAYAAEEIR
jgi:hypothetical protein